MKHHVISICSALALAATCHAAAKPNVVIIFMDVMGYGDIGPFGATQQKTPALDRMAAEGMKLTSFYAAPVCSVSRAQLLTGCYGLRIEKTNLASKHPEVVARLTALADKISAEIGGHPP